MEIETFFLLPFGVGEVDFFLPLDGESLLRPFFFFFWCDLVLRTGRFSETDPLSSVVGWCSFSIIGSARPDLVNGRFMDSFIDDVELWHDDVAVVAVVAVVSDNELQSPSNANDSDNEPMSDDFLLLCRVCGIVLSFPVTGWEDANKLTKVIYQMKNFAGRACFFRGLRCLLHSYPPVHPIKRHARL